MSPAATMAFPMLRGLRLGAFGRKVDGLNQKRRIPLRLPPAAMSELEARASDRPQGK